MCGRFEIHSSLEIIATIFNISADDITIPYRPNYNVAPTHDIPIVKQNGGRILGLCRWGFIPSWAKEEKIGYKMINARAETVAEKPTYKKAFLHQRCLIVADGFYEWKKSGKDKKPVYIRLKSGEPFGFAGLYNTWISPEGEDICTCTIVTTDANDLLAPIHPRMPVITQKDHHALWLDPESHDPARLLPVLKPYASDDLEYYEVSPQVNSPRNNTPDNIKPVYFSNNS